jgi:S1-C subfamily serine protease
MTKFRHLFETYASAVAYVSVESRDGTQSIGTAFHVGEGVFVTARHVVENKTIRSVATTQGTMRPLKSPEGAYEAVHHAGTGRVTRGPFLHPNSDVDVAALVVDGIDAPIIPLGGHLDDWLGTELVLCPVLVLGYPPIPFSREPLLVAATGEVNAIVDKYTGGHPQFVLSTMARGGFSGGLALTDFGCALGVITESLGQAGQPAELGYFSVLTVEPIYVCLAHHGIMPKAMHKEWGEGDSDKSLWKSQASQPAHQQATGGTSGN